MGKDQCSMQSVRTYKDHLPQSCVKCLQDKEGVIEEIWYRET